MQIKKQIKYVVALLLIVLPTTALAASVTLRWQANQEPDILSYNVYYGTQSRSYGLPIPAGNVTSHTIENLTEGSTYYFGVTAVDTSGNESGFSSEITADATSSEPVTEDYQLLLSTNSDHSNAVQLNGQSISGDVYIFLDPEANVSQVVFSMDGQVHNTENYAPYDIGLPFDSRSLRNGNHTISALIIHQDQTTQTISAECVVENTANDPVYPISVVLDSSVASPQSAGSVVTFTATGSGGSGNYEYSYWAMGQATGNVHTLVRGFSTSPNFDWNTSGYTGVNTITAAIRNVGSTASHEAYTRMSYTVTALAPPSAPTPASSVSFSSTQSSPQPVGTVVSFTAMGSGGSGNYEYSYWVMGPTTGNVHRLIRNFSTSPEFNWNTAGYTGINTITAAVRNVGSTEPYYEAYTRVNFTVSSIGSPTTPVLPASSVSLSADQTSPQSVGTVVSFSASGSGGSGNYEYSFWVMGPVTGNVHTLVRGFSTSPDFDWNTTGYTGVNTITAAVRNVGSTEPYYEAFTRMNFTVTVVGSASSVSLSAAQSSPQSAGTVVRFTASGSGGSDNYEYSYWVMGPATGNVHRLVRGFSTSPEFNWNTTGYPGVNTVTVAVRNVGSMEPYYEAYTRMTFTIQ